MIEEPDNYTKLDHRLIAHEMCGLNEEKRFEKIHTIIFEKSTLASKTVALEISELIRSKQANGELCVLGLATGSSPIGVYNELVRMHKEEGLSFQHVVTFNLDEYFPMQTNSLQSYWHFMHEYLFDHVDIKPEHINIPDGTIAEEDVNSYCKEYEEKIAACGGLDLQVLGIGRTGHIGFNEPGSHINSITRMVTLDQLTREDASGDFYGSANVPRRAITMGIGTIMKAKRVILLAWGESKASIVAKTVEGNITHHVPATYLQNHNNATFVLDEGASADLKRIHTPWLVGSCTWDKYATKRAVIWLCQTVNKPILKLTDRDYNEYGMNDLISSYGSSYDLNIQMFNAIQRTITGWPGGKPNADDSQRPERANPPQKRAIIFSPHPDDDVISMGGTFIRLHDQGHEVHVAYQTSGNIAVFDEEVVKYANFYSELKSLNDSRNEKPDSFYKNIRNAVLNKKSGDIDTAEVRNIKGLIRRGEARAACRFVGIPDERAHFLDLPFYETGKVKKNQVGAEDLKITVDILRKIKPHQIFTAGDLSDPHGTHRVCLELIFKAIKVLKNEDWMKDCYVWLYRGAWHEWGIEDIDMVVPLSPDQLLKKRKAIFNHQSQKDNVVFQGSDNRQFWQRAEDRNRNTASQYNQLGLSEYEAMEAFKRYYF